jgi:hypothetical protein
MIRLIHDAERDVSERTSDTPREVRVSHGSVYLEVRRDVHIHHVDSGGPKSTPCWHDLLISLVTDRGSDLD